MMAKKLSLKSILPRINEKTPTKAETIIEKIRRILIFKPKTLYIRAGKNTSPGGNKSQKSRYGNSPFITLIGLLIYSAKSAPTV
jgi:hypothetical protein